MKTWLIEARNPKFDGKTLGVSFQGGKATVNSHMIPKELGRKVEDIVHAFQSDFPVTVTDELGNSTTTQGYKVRLIDGKEDEETEPVAPAGKKSKSAVSAE